MGIQGLVYASRLMCCSIRKQAMVTAWFVLVRSIYLLFVAEMTLDILSAFMKEAQRARYAAAAMDSKNSIQYDDGGVDVAYRMLSGIKYGILCGSIINIGCSICLLVATVRLDKKCLVWPFMIVSGISVGATIIIGIVGAALVPAVALSVLIGSITLTLEEGFLLFVAVAFYKSIGAGIYGAADDTAVLVDNEMVVDGVRIEGNRAVGDVRLHSSGVV